jgi:hypothetical protein
MTAFTAKIRHAKGALPSASLVEIMAPARYGRGPAVARVVEPADTFALRSG